MDGMQKSDFGFCTHKVLKQDWSLLLCPGPGCSNNVSANAGVSANVGIFNCNSVKQTKQTKVIL